jgi:hypothetical protein
MLCCCPSLALVYAVDEVRQKHVAKRYCD